MSEEDAAPTPAKNKAAAKRPRAKKTAAPPRATDDADVPAAAPKAAPSEKPAGTGKQDVVFPKAFYDERKDEIKAPFKQHKLKWQYMGEGRGRYHKEGVSVFVLFADEKVHYSISGADRTTIDAMLAAWKEQLGADVLQEARASGEVAAAEKAKEPEPESEEMRLWRLQEPQRRPGEPDFFLRKRTEEWQARRPAK